MVSSGVKAAVRANNMVVVACVRIVNVVFMFAALTLFIHDHTLNVNFFKTFFKLRIKKCVRFFSRVDREQMLAGFDIRIKLFFILDCPVHIRWKTSI